MKKGIALLLIAFASNAAAGTALNDKYCNGIGALAASAMGAHQSGVPLSTAIKVGALDDVSRRIVIEAYEHPRYSTESVRQRAIADFRDKQHLRCLKDTK